MTKQDGYRIKLSEDIVERLKGYAKSRGHFSWEINTIGHSGGGLAAEDVVSELLTEAGF